MLTKNCQKCGKEIFKKINCSKKDWELVKFCSRSCINKGRIPYNKGIKSNIPAWNKGLKICLNTGRTHIKKGQRLSPKTEFGNKEPWNKGKNLHYKVWNKGTIGVMKAWNKGTGVTHWLENFKHLLEYKNWRKACFERDKYICQECGINSHFLQVHHKESRAKIFKQFNITTLDDALKCNKLWDINNGITLCKDCHKKTDSYGKHTKHN